MPEKLTLVARQVNKVFVQWYQKRQIDLQVHNPSSRFHLYRVYGCYYSLTCAYFFIIFNDSLFFATKVMKKHNLLCQRGIN